MAITFIDKLQSSNPDSFALIDATEIGGHRAVLNYAALANIPTAILTPKGDYSDADGQLWYVLEDTTDSEGTIIHPKGFYQLTVTVSGFGDHIDYVKHWNQFSAGDLMFVTEEKDTTTSEYALGSIGAKTPASFFKTKTISQILDIALFPTYTPNTSDNPKVSLTAKNTLVRVGSDAPSLATTNSGYTITAPGFNVTFNPGKITLNGAESQKRAGNVTSSTIYYSANGNPLADPTTAQTITKLNTLGSYKFHIKVTYAQGPQPLDNKGHNVGSPLPAGSVQSATPATVTTTWPAYATKTSGTSDALGFVELDLKTYGSAGNVTYTDIELIEHSTTVPLKIKVPRELTSIIPCNENSLTPYLDDNEELFNWTKSAITELINGVNHEYYIYTYNGSTRNSGKFKFVY